jgi:hypothetical protein
MSSAARRGPRDGRLAALAFWGFAALLAWAPLPLGSTRSWAWLLLAGAAMALTALWGAAALVRPHVVRVPGRRLALAAMPFAIAIAWFLLQTTTILPSPEEALWQQTARTLGRTLAATGSLDARATLLGVLRLAGYAAVFFLAVQFGRDAKRAETLLWVIAFAAVAYAA